MMYLTSQNTAGFSLVEMLVAISILLLVIVGPMTVSSRAAKSSSFATEQVQAFFHAQEGLEMVQKVRDDEQLVEFGTPLPVVSPFTASFILATCINNVARGCGLAWDANSPEAVKLVNDCGDPTSLDCRLYLRNDLTGNQRSKFSHSANASSETPFTRRIKVTHVPGSDMIKISSEVTWRTGALIAEQKVVAVTYLYDIYK